MKMVKSLLLGSAAGLVAVAGAQAADLPVKAKPVQYVKICSLYGAGFYYIPGTDMCVKIGGWVRFEAAYNTNGNLTNGAFAGNVNNRATNDMAWRSRGYITADARNQTAYGTVRSYIAVGLNTSSTGLDNAANQFSANRAFIQWAGFTFGLTQSFFDFYSVPATSYWGAFPASDTGDPGWQAAAYTAQFGNGFSATISAEQRRMTQIINAAAGAGAAGAATGVTAIGGFSTTGSTVSGAGAYGGWKAPDIVANLRVDQAWGSAQVMGALHQVNGTYYGATGNEVGGAGVSNKWGFAVGGGLKLLAPMIGKGDYFQAQVNYAQGASRYVVSTPNFNYGYRSGNSAGFGLLSDAVYGGNAATASAVELTTAWGFNAAYEHFWNPAWRTSLYGGYAAISYNANANAMLCATQGQAVATASNGVGTTALAGCNNNWSTAWVGTRTQWNVTPDFYLGLDVMYQNLKTATSSTGLNGTGTISATVAPAGSLTIANQNVWQFRFRAHKDFYP